MLCTITGIGILAGITIGGLGGLILVGFIAIKIIEWLWPHLASDEAWGLGDYIFPGVLTLVCIFLLGAFLIMAHDIGCSYIG